MATVHDRWRFGTKLEDTQQEQNKKQTWKSLSDVGIDTGISNTAVQCVASRPNATECFNQSPGILLFQRYAQIHKEQSQIAGQTFQTKLVFCNFNMDKYVK